MSTEFPKKISENGWYELSNGETIRGEEAALKAEEELALEEDLDETEEVSKGPLVGDFERETEEEDDLEGKVCINCGASATWVDDPPTAKKAYFCTVHRPVYLR